MALSFIKKVFTFGKPAEEPVPEAVERELEQRSRDEDLPIADDPVLPEEMDTAGGPAADVVVVLSDRKLAPADASDTGRLEAMSRKEGLVALVVRLDPDAKLMSAEPLHPAFTSFVSSAAFARWKPSAYDEKRVAGRFWTEGAQKEFRQEWSYDVTFSAPIVLDPAARTAPKK